MKTKMKKMKKIMKKKIAKIIISNLKWSCHLKIRLYMNSPMKLVNKTKKMEKI